MLLPGSARVSAQPWPNRLLAISLIPSLQNQGHNMSFFLPLSTEIETKSKQKVSCLCAFLVLSERGSLTSDSSL